VAAGVAVAASGRAASAEVVEAAAGATAVGGAGSADP
jgi:hypothetical protein